MTTIDWPSNNFVCAFVWRNGDRKYYCMLCNYIICDDTALDAHVNAKRHVNALKLHGDFILPSKSNLYRCRHCNCTINGFDKVYMHLIGRKHRNDVGNGMEEWPWNQGFISWDDSDHFAFPFVTREDYQEYFCLICNYDIHGYADFWTHVEGKRHEDSVKRYGHHIQPMGEKRYYCNCCDCTVPPYGTVYEHIMGLKHQGFMRGFDRQRIKRDTEKRGEEDKEGKQSVDKNYALTKEPITRENECRQLDRHESHGDKKDDEKAEAKQLNKAKPEVKQLNETKPEVKQLNETKPEVKHLKVEADQLTKQKKESCWELDYRKLLDYKTCEEKLEVKKMKVKTDQIIKREEENWQLDYHNLSSDEMWQLHYYNILQEDDTTDEESEEGKQPKIDEKEAERQRSWENSFEAINPKTATSSQNLFQASEINWQLKCDADEIEKQKVFITDNQKLPGELRSPKELNNIMDNPSNTVKTETTRVCSQNFDTQTKSRCNYNSIISYSVSFYSENDAQKDKNDMKKTETWSSTKSGKHDEVKTKEIHRGSSEMRAKMVRVEKDVNGNKRIIEVKRENTSVFPAESEALESINGLRFLGKDIVNNSPIADNSIDQSYSDLSFDLTFGDATISALINEALADTGSRNDGSPRRRFSDSNKNPYPEKNRIFSTKKLKMQRIKHLLNYDKDMYDTKNKIREIRLSLELSLVIDSRTFYCLVCRKIITKTCDNCIEHLCDPQHRDYLERMENGMIIDKSLFEVVGGQFNEIYLAYQYMEVISKEKVRCLICYRKIGNDEETLREHVNEDVHRKNCEIMHEKSMQNLETIASQVRCDWYKIHKYRCLPCSANFDTQMNFIEHLESPKHESCLEKSEDTGKGLVYDFCEICSLLWYGYRSAYADHCDSSGHKWNAQHGRYVSTDLSESAKRLLVAADKYVGDTIEYLDDATTKGPSNEAPMRDLANAVRAKFPRAKCFVYGSRASGLGVPDSDINIFLDCGDAYAGKISSDDEIAYRVTSVHKCLIDDPHTWDMEKPLTSCESAVVKVHHRSTGLFCVISFKNGLAVENTKLIKTLNDGFPMCRKLIIFLKQWLAFCDLSGSERITNYALCWCVIFYLQKQSILPNVAALIEAKKKSRKIAGWEVGANYDFVGYRDEHEFSLVEHLRLFFAFYANFDFRSSVACPVLGETVKKRAFANPEDLPKEMKYYIDYINNEDDPEPLRIDAVMCLQDPFDLQRNITKSVSKVTVSRFRTCCATSFNLLCAS